MCDKDNSVSSQEIADFILGGMTDSSIDTRIEAIKALSRMMLHDGDLMRGDTSCRDQLISQAFGVSHLSIDELMIVFDDNTLESKRYRSGAFGRARKRETLVVHEAIRHDCGIPASTDGAGSYRHVRIHYHQARPGL